MKLSAPFVPSMNFYQSERTGITVIPYCETKCINDRITSVSELKQSDAIRTERFGGCEFERAAQNELFKNLENISLLLNNYYKKISKNYKIIIIMIKVSEKRRSVSKKLVCASTVEKNE